jgi:16S rRNA C1402 (ribose-2'-O) methylase RsmI
VKGEITVVLAGAGKPEPADLPAIREALRERLATPGVSWKEAVAEVARELGAGKKEVYREALALKKNPSSGS